MCNLGSNTLRNKLVLKKKKKTDTPISSILYSVCNRIRQHDPAYQVIPQNYPVFLWWDSVYNKNNPFIGFLQNVLLVKVWGIMDKLSDSMLNLM